MNFAGLRSIQSKVILLVSGLLVAAALIVGFLSVWPNFDTKGPLRALLKARNPEKSRG